MILNRFNNLRSRLKTKYLILTANRRYSRALQEVKGKPRVKVAFFVIHSAVWKFDLVYRMFENDARFEPVVVICPYVSFGQEVMVTQMKQSQRFFEEKAYRVITTYDPVSGQWLDLKKTLKPDIIFFTNPYNITMPEYFITNWLNTLTYYVPYAFMISDRPDMMYNGLLHNLVYKIFYETSVHLQEAVVRSGCKGANGIAVGYPGLDGLLFPEEAEVGNVWKVENPDCKRIIWAPHHTIAPEETEFNYSTFLEYADIFFVIADVFKDEVQIAFKPHPILKAKLYEAPGWGREKTDQYYKKWEELANGQLEEGSYIDLFRTSDALIHDSGSFLTEYISLNKPSLYMVRNDLVLNGFTQLGDEVINCHYLSHNIDELYGFIRRVIAGEDNMRAKRQTLIDRFLIPPFGNTASKNMYDHICHEIFSK